MTGALEDEHLEARTPTHFLQRKAKKEQVAAHPRNSSFERFALCVASLDLRNC